MKNIIVFGELPIATKIVQYLEALGQVNIPFVVCENYKAKNSDPWPNTPMLFEYAESKGIPVIQLKDLDFFASRLYSKPAVGVSARFSKILKEEHLSVFEHGVINLHGGLLPEFGGLYSVNHMLLSGTATGGGTIHWVDLGIDTGKPIRRCTCEISKFETALTLHHKVQAVLYGGIKGVLKEGLKEGFNKISYDQVPAGLKREYYSKSSLDGLKEIQFSELSSELAIRKIRAFDFPGHEPAYTIINGIKVRLRIGG